MLNQFVHQFLKNLVSVYDILLCLMTNVDLIHYELYHLMHLLYLFLFEDNALLVIGTGAVVALIKDRSS